MLIWCLRDVTLYGTGYLQIGVDQMEITQRRVVRALAAEKWLPSRSTALSGQTCMALLRWRN
jgi:hypothetical protein